MKIILELKDLREAKTLSDEFVLAAEEAHDRGDKFEEDFFQNLEYQIDAQIEKHKKE